jgi:hypothetical protein
MNNNASSPIVSGGSFHDNTALNGGGMYNNLSDPELSGTKVYDNSASTSGGGMYNEESSPKISDCQFYDNAAMTTGASSSIGGGALYSNGLDSSALITDSSFHNNIATNGGALFDSSGAPTLLRSEFFDNTATIGGGARYFQQDWPTVIDCAFYRNAAATGGLYGGGAMYLLSVSARIIHSSFYDNTAGRGGAIYQSRNSLATMSDVSVFGSLFFRNSADTGGGIRVQGVDGDSALSIINSAFYANVAPSNGPALYNAGGVPSLEIYNSIFWGHGTPPLDGVAGVADVSDSIVEGGLMGGINILETDPLFEDPLAGDFHLEAASPAIDTGDTNLLPLDATDLDDDTNVSEFVPVDKDGNPRVVGMMLDIGPFEVQ